MDEANLVTAVGALAVADALEDFADVQARIRFPNDVLVKGKKISGTLVEARLISSVPDFFIVGIGINANLESSDLPAGFATEATSLKIETGAEIDRSRFAARLLRKLDGWVQELGLSSGHERIQTSWKDRSALLGRTVEIREAGHAISGKVEDIDVFKGLLLRTGSGHVRHARAEHIEYVRIV
jgi:BirA family biotin operon repressor/biotin-[acetyl-CoA-carboxylase] ligase